MFYWGQDLSQMGQIARSSRRPPQKPRRKLRPWIVEPFGRNGFYYWLGARYRKGKISYQEAQGILDQTALVEGDNQAKAKHWFEIGQYNM